MLKTSNIKKIQRKISYYTNIGFLSEQSDVLRIILTDVKNEFFGTDNPTNATQQFEILKRTFGVLS